MSISTPVQNIVVETQLTIKLANPDSTGSDHICSGCTPSFLVDFGTGVFCQTFTITDSSGTSVSYQTSCISPVSSIVVNWTGALDGGCLFGACTNCSDTFQVSAGGFLTSAAYTVYIDCSGCSGC